MVLQVVVRVYIPSSTEYVLVNLTSFSGLALTVFQLLLCESVAGVGVQHFGDGAAGMPVSCIEMPEFPVPVPF